MHDDAGALPAPVVDLVHRVTTDAARLTRRWYEATLAAGLDPESYVEALGVTTQVISVDAFHHALGLPLEPLPEPRPGEPSRRRPEGAALEDAFVPMLRPDRLAPGERDLFGGLPRTGNVLRALSLVPEEVRALTRLSAAQYLTPRQMLRFDSPRAIDRAQIELIAGRVSALRECFY
jgi:alkylhydroperoxidase family enzyme